MRPAGGVTALLFCALFPAMVRAETGAVNVLNKAGAVRSDAMGGTGTAVGKDPSLVWLNPASIAAVASPSITLAGQRGYFGELLGQAIIAAPLVGGVMSFGCMYYDTGRVEAWMPDGTSRTFEVQQDFMGALTYSQPFTASLTAGATVKGINSVLFGEASSAAAAFDLGAQYRLNSMVKFGASVRNIGTRLRYFEDDIPLPADARAGAAFGFPIARNRDMAVVTADAEYPLSGEGVAWGVGGEYQWNGIASVRLGLRIPAKKELASFGAGAGLTFQQYRFDYTLRLGKDFDSPQSVSVTYTFPRETPSPDRLGAPATAAPVRTAPSSSTLTEPAPEPPKKGTTDDLNDELEELLRQTGEK